jgi:hypothetical protein
MVILYYCISLQNSSEKNDFFHLVRCLLAIISYVSVIFKKDYLLWQNFFPCGRTGRIILKRVGNTAPPPPPSILPLRTGSRLRAAAPAVALQRAVEKEGG